MKELNTERKGGEDENWESAAFSLQPAVVLCKNVTAAPETWLGILEAETGIFLKCTVSCFLSVIALLPSHKNLLFPPLSRLLVFRRPVPGAGEALRGCCGQAVRQAAGPRHHRRLQGAKTWQPPSGLAHALQRKGYGTALLPGGLAGIMHALGVCGYMEMVSFPPLKHFHVRLRMTRDLPRIPSVGHCVLL